MPPKTPPPGKDKEKKVTLVNGELPSQIVFRLRRIYERNCHNDKSLPCPGVMKCLQEAKDNEDLVRKVILYQVPATKVYETVVSIDPLVQAVQNCRYTYLEKLYVWNIPVKHEHVANLAMWIEKPRYPLRRLELMNCRMEAQSVIRLGHALNQARGLTEVFLDYNEFGDAGCEGFCEALLENNNILQLSMKYCEITARSGKALGLLLGTTAIQELYLQGNELEMTGAAEVVKFCAAQAEKEFKEKIEEEKRKAEADAAALEKYLAEQAVLGVFATRTTPQAKDDDNSKSGKKKKKGKEPPKPPPVGPWVYKLDLRDNGMDNFFNRDESLICMKCFSQLIRYSRCLQELDLADNHIGDAAGRLIMEGLLDRKDAELPPVKVQTSHKMGVDTFQVICTLGGGPKKKKKKGKKKKKKKK